VMQVQGQSMLKGWKLPNRFPDIFIYSRLTQMKLEDIKEVESIPGIKKGQVMPITLTSPQFGSNIFALAGAALLPNATMFFGIDPEKAFDLIELDFRVGNAADAKEMLRKGRHLVVTEEFRKVKGLTVGDKVPLNTPRHGTVDYTIAGVVWSPGIDVMVGVFDLDRQFEQRTVASVFGSIADAREDFGVDGVYVFAANLDYFISKEKVLKEVQAKLGDKGLEAGDVRQIKANIEKAFGNLLLLVSSVAFAAMAVSSLGVTNTMMASIRSRRWQFGILRSVGTTRSQLLRLVMSEAVLLGIIGCGLGLTAGLEMSSDARRLSTITIGFGPPVYIPWHMIFIGVGIIMVVAVVASALPAFRVSREEPLALLQAGRAAV
jgi:putative ABC transport system permease protein